MQNAASPPPEAMPFGGVHENIAPTIPQPRVVSHPEPANRRVKRDLRSIHIFLIVISGTIGMGLFQNSGAILGIAGPGGGITAFTVVGFGTMMVMEGIAEMVTHWPISNAMIEFVRVFIDKELAVVIGIAYSYAYSISFTTLIIAAGDLASHWNWSTTIQNITFILIVPIFLLNLNCFGVLYYGNIEAFCGILKIGLVLMAFVTMIVINHLIIPDGQKGSTYIDENFKNNPAVAMSPFIATLVALPVATYAYLGVEIVAVTAVEAKSPHSSLRVSARSIAWITALMYITSVISYYYNVEWTDTRLPAYRGRVSNSAPNVQQSPTHDTLESSSIVIIATLSASEIPLSNAVSGLLVMAVLSAANTALYVSSRTLWGLACNLDPQLLTSSNVFWRCLSKLSTTTPTARVPGWALLLSAATFWWLLPFVLLAKSTSSVNVEGIMSGAATVGVVIVWASQCLAFIRYRGWLSDYRGDLTEGYAQFDHFNHSEESKRFNSILGWTQCWPAWIGLFFSLAIVIVFSTASWWNNGESVVDIVSAFAGPVALFFFWLALKIWRYARGDDFEWWVTVESWNELRAKLDGLTNAIHRRDNDQPPQPGIPLGPVNGNQGYPFEQSISFNGTGPPSTPNALHIVMGTDQDKAVSTGYAQPLRMEHIPDELTEYQQRDHEPMESEPRHDIQWNGQYPPAGPAQQVPRRRSIRQNHLRLV